MKLKIFVTILLFLILSCNNKKKNKNFKLVQADSLQSKISSNNFEKLDTTFKDSNVVVLGDTVNSIKYVPIKFKLYIRFNDFRIDIFNKKKKAPIKYSSNPTAKKYKTVITTTYRNEGLNFAGHYCFVEWGCGSPCQQSALVDLNNGIVYDGISASLGYKYQKDSRMLIVNPPDSSGFYLNCSYCEPLVLYGMIIKKILNRDRKTSFRYKVSIMPAQAGIS